MGTGTQNGINKKLLYGSEPDTRMNRVKRIHIKSHLIVRRGGKFFHLAYVILRYLFNNNKNFMNKNFGTTAVTVNLDAADVIK